MTANDARAACLLSWVWVPRRYLQDNAIVSIDAGALEGLHNLQHMYVAEALPMLRPSNLLAYHMLLLQSPSMVLWSRVAVCTCPRVAGAHSDANVGPCRYACAFPSSATRLPVHRRALLANNLRAAASWTTTTCGHCPRAFSAATLGSKRSA